MSERSNRQFLSDLFAGPFRGHAIVIETTTEVEDYSDWDPAVSGSPVKKWVPEIISRYEERVRVHEAIGDDAVPYASLWTGTALFAAAFGSPVHVSAESVPCALPFVTTAAEADKLATPDLTARPLERMFELGQMVREVVGPGVPIGIPDIQSPFDIAALIWRKEDLFVALHEEPDPVKRLVEKCHVLLASFVEEFKRVFPECNLCHCPYMWAPPGLGCWLSEDEVGSMNQAMFREFCLPSLVRLSEQFGGLFMHCCAAADHQYSEFNKIPNLRGINRVFQAPGPRPAIEAFAGRTVLVQAWMTEDQVMEMVDMALPNSRFAFDMQVADIDEGKALYERLRKACPRT